jgi:ABC-2 type transport system permease protein
MAANRRRLQNPLNVILRNPVALKELRGRMRGPRAFIVMTMYLVVVGGFTIIIYLAATGSATTSTGEIDGGEVGRLLFSAVVAMELFLVTFITPAFTASAISGEHERQTYDLLRTTLLPEQSLVWGKLFSAIAYIILLLLAAIPLQSIAFLFGGVDIPEVYIAFVVLMATAFFLGTLGVYFSAMSRRTLRANIMTYVTAMAVALITAVLLVLTIGVFDSLTTTGSTIMSPGVEWLLLLGRGLLICLNPLSTLLVTQDFLVNQQSVFTIDYTFQNGNMVTLPSPWIIFTIIYVLISVALFVRTTKILQKIEE